MYLSGGFLITMRQPKCPETRKILRLVGTAVLSVEVASHVLWAEQR